ncbi:MAG: hypothetical protein ACR2NJ_05285 [Acidimicrobiales bacterium]
MRRLLAVAPAVVAAVVLSGCGGSSTKTSATPTSGPTTTLAGSAARAAYVQCMTNHGIPASALRFGRGGGGLGGPPGGGGAGSGAPGTGAPGTDSGSSVPPSTTARTLPPGVTQSQFDSAQATCRPLLPQGFANSPAAAAYRNCLTVHGVTATTIAGGPSPTLNRNDPTVAAALQACAPLRPGRSTTSSTAAGSTAAGS